MSSLQESFRVKILLKYRIIWIKDGWIVYTWNVIVSRHFLQTILISAAFFEWVILSEVVFFTTYFFEPRLLEWTSNFMSFIHFIFITFCGCDLKKLWKTVKINDVLMPFQFKMLNGSYFLLDQFHGSAYCEWTVGACGFRKTFVWRQAFWLDAKCLLHVTYHSPLTRLAKLFGANPVSNEWRL